MAKTPPKNLQFIPGFSPTKQSGLCENNNTHKLAECKGTPDNSCELIDSCSLVCQTGRMILIEIFLCFILGTSSVAQSRSAAAGDSELFEMDL